MKKLITILLLFVSVFTYAQITTIKVQGSGGSGTTGVDSIWRTLGQDSIKFSISGRLRSIKDSGSVQNLQQVTDVGNVTTRSIYVDSLVGTSDAKIHNLTVGNGGITGVTLLGVSAGSANTSADLTAIGYQAGMNNIGAVHNTFIGQQAGFSATTANTNTFIGWQSGYSTNTGNSNTFIGNFTGRGNTTGSANVFIGHTTGSSNTTGASNTFIGNSAGGSNSTAGSNTAVGSNSGGGSTGYSNTSLGRFAGAANLTGLRNISIGDSAGRLNTSGNYNILIGYNALLSSNTGISNAIALGTDAIASTQQLVISDSIISMKFKNLDSATGTAPSVIGKDGAGNWHVYATPSGGGVGNTIYTGDGTITGNRTVDLAGFDLSFNDGGGTSFSLNPSGGQGGFSTPLGKSLIVSDNLDQASISYDGSNNLVINSTGTTVTSDSIALNSTLSGTSNGYVWTLANSALGTGYWAAASGGITDLNGETGTTQTFATGTTGTDFTINSATNVHTFNIPSSSASNRGLLTSTDWSTFNNKASTSDLANYLLKAGDAYTTTTGNGLGLTSSTLTTGTLAALTITGTAAASNTKKAFSITSSGANATASQTVTGQTISVTNTGTTNTNVGLNVTASGATNNYAALFTGKVGIGTSTLTRELEIASTGNVGMNIIGASGGGTSYATIGIYEGATRKFIIEKGPSEDFYISRDGTNSDFFLQSTGRIGLAVTSPTAVLHIKAGTATASTAPLKFTSGTLLTTAEAGAVEFLTDAYYGTTTTGAARRMFVAGTSGRSVAATAAVGSVSTYTLGASDASYEVSANVLVTTSSAEAFTVTCAYTDEGNTARTVTLPFVVLAGTTVAAINFANGAVPYEGVPIHIRVKASTAITIATTGTFTGSTYNCEGVIKQIQ